MKEKNNMDKKVTYILEIRSAYNEIKKAISYNFTNKKPLYIAKNENDDNIDGTLEYLADITKIKTLPEHFEIHLPSKNKHNKYYSLTEDIYSFMYDKENYKLDKGYINRRKQFFSNVKRLVHKLNKGANTDD
tara:strand:- start:1008 stop:1403 length:396 start_codon:yes stop_codon:yes gene_type:complete